MGPLIKYTDRLILKVIDGNYSSLVLDLYNRNKASFEQFEPTRPNDFYTDAFQKRTLQREYQGYSFGTFLRYYIFPKNNTKKIIGAINFNNLIGYPVKSAVIGYKLDSDYQGDRIAFEACTAAINVMVNEYGIKVFHAHIHPENHPSLNLAKRLGFEYVGYEPNATNILGKPADLYHYVLTISIIQ